MKTLIFEGAGMDYEANEYSDVCNYRIRTAFTNNIGAKIYLEMGRTPVYSMIHPRLIVNDWALYISDLFYITGDNDDENKYRISFDWQEVKTHNYTAYDIIQWINKNLHCDFDTLQVVSDFEDYRVHGDNHSYNLMENHSLNPARTVARKAAYAKVDQEYREHCKSKYSVISIMSMDDHSITIRCNASDKVISDKPRITVIPVNYEEAAQ